MTPTLDPTVEDEVWKGDDGKRHAGAGTLELAVDPDGTASGTLDGPLGPSRIHGVADEEVVRATIGSTAEDGVAGTLVARLEGETLTIEARTSDGAGKTPRLARGTLKRAR